MIINKSVQDLKSGDMILVSRFSVIYLAEVSHFTKSGSLCIKIGDYTGWVNGDLERVLVNFKPTSKRYVQPNYFSFVYICNKEQLNT